MTHADAGTQAPLRSAQLSALREDDHSAEAKENSRCWKKTRSVARCGPGCGPRGPALADGCGKLVDAGEKAGKLKAFANTPALSLIVEDGRIKGVKTTRARSWPIMSSSAPVSGVV
ncbi:MAG: hypothetical protein R3D78_05955 [Paracoccaceae bacterium]